MAEEKSVRVITFTGLAGDWRTWKFKFMAKATALGYCGVLLGTINVPDDDEDIDEDDIGAEELLVARKANVMAYSALALACEGAALGLVEGSVTEGLPNGDAGLAWRNLCRKYEPNTRMSLVSLKKEFAECKLEDVNSDPEVWVRELEHLHLRIRGVNAENALTDEDMMAHILANLPVEYSELITTVESELDREGGDFGLDDLMTRIRGFYKRKFENRATDKEEVALAAGQFFKGLCHRCGKYGHKAANCPEGKGNEKGQKKRFAGKCFYCGKTGHKQEDCFKKKADECVQDKVDLVLSCVAEKDETPAAGRIGSSGSDGR